MKAQKIIIIFTIILLVAILSVASFLGIYKLINYKVRNVVPDYILGKEFTKSRAVELTVDDSVASTKIYDKDGNEVLEQEEGVEYTEENGYKTEEIKTNPEDLLTAENYIKAKKIIAKRLKKFGVDQYKVKLDEETGAINLDIPENDDTDRIISNLISIGKLELVDSQTNEVLLDSTCIKDTKVVYSQSEEGTIVFLQIQYNKEASKKLEEISKTYIQTKGTTTNEEGEEEETTETKNVSLMFDGQSLRTTYFGDEPITNGLLNLPIGQSKDTSTLQEYVENAKKISTLINIGIMPISYTQKSEVKENSVNILDNKIVFYAGIAVIAIAAVFLIIRLKLKGILALVLQIGYVALLLLTLRYTNIKITLTGLIGIGISIILNYFYVYIAFKNIDENFVKETTRKFAIKLIPFYIIAVIFTFNSLANIFSIGMTLFWGILVMYVYNLCLTGIMIKTIKD